MLNTPNSYFKQIYGNLTGLDYRSFFQKNWRWVVAVVVICLLLLGAYGTGRYLQPPKTVTKEHVVTQEHVQEKVVYQDRVVEKVVYVKTQAKNTHKETTVVKAPDGTTTTKVVEDNHLDTKVDNQTQKDSTTQETKVTEKVVYQDRVVEKIVQPSKPDWRLGALVGVDIMTTLNPISRAQPIPQLGPVTIGVEAERRIVGPFSLGIWGTTSGQVGVLGNLEF